MINSWPEANILIQRRTQTLFILLYSILFICQGQVKLIGGLPFFVNHNSGIIEVLVFENEAEGADEDHA